MNTREKFKRQIIELVDGTEYFSKCYPCKGTGRNEHCTSPTGKCYWCDGKGKKRGVLPITIGRVMQALGNRRNDIIVRFGDVKNNKNAYFIYSGEKSFVADTRYETTEAITKWQLTKENGIECTDDDQSDETIEKLLKLLNINK